MRPLGPTTSALPLDKAEYLHQMFKPHLPDFPLGAEVRARIPDDLPGEIPNSLGEYVEALRERYHLGAPR